MSKEEIEQAVDKMLAEKPDPGSDPKLMAKYIKKVGKEPDKPWCIVSKKTGRNIACYPSKSAAEKAWPSTMKRVHTFG